GLLQLTVLLAAGKLLFKMNLGPDLWSLPVVAAAGAALLGSLYLPLALVTRNEKQMSSLGTGLTLVLGMLGGSFVPTDNLPGFLQKIAALAPNGWAVRAMTDVIARDEPLREVAPLVLRLLIASMVLLAVSLAIHRGRGREALL
ncbi:ABC transporter permease, partial [bacterium]|nr:ABC transporter permease [bacterium]